MTTKKNTSGRRYSADEKANIVKFVRDYNAEKGRGGQNNAAKKFNISPITIANWLKADGGSKPVATKKTVKATEKKAAKNTAKKASKRAKRRSAKRYSDAQKEEILQFLADYNAQNGRGGQSVAARKFDVSPITLMSWAKKAGKPGKPTKKAAKKTTKKAAEKAAKKATKSANPSVASSSITAKLAKLNSVHHDIAATEEKLARLQSEFESLKNSL